LPILVKAGTMVNCPGIRGILRQWTRSIWRVADLLVKEYGDEAVFLASERADALLDQGDMDGFTEWLKVVKAIETLQRKGPPEGEAVN
jgi:hypothetical protein